MSAGPLGICLALAASQPLPVSTSAAVPTEVFVPGHQFTLAWTHSIEKVRWEEDYVVLAGAAAAPPRLTLPAARIRGTGAGMEPPDGAVLKDGWYTYRPSVQPEGALRLTRSAFTADYVLCTVDGCRPMSDWLPSDGGITWLRACTAPDSASPR